MSDSLEPARQRPSLVKVIIVGSVMFTFISYWRTAAVVLCDMASTAYYIGGIVEQSIGPAAPWFILGVLVLAFAVGLVYIESCSLFVRGGVYRVVRAALGSTPAKLAVSALIFDYILTGPISTVSAGQYIMGLILESLGPDVARALVGDHVDQWRNGLAVVFACGVTLYFFWLNLKGIHESSDRALKIMIITTVMAVLVFAWCGATLAIRGPVNPDIPFEPTLPAKIDPVSGEKFDPLGFLVYILPQSWLDGLRGPYNWLLVTGVLAGITGIVIAFGHSILAMSGLETLAQVYREVESPKLPNFKKAAFIVFTYALLLTGTISFMAVLLIPESARTTQYKDNLIGGVVMNLVGPKPALLLLNAFVTIVGAFILSGACNTSIIGANGVLNRVAEDGILPDWFRKPHPRYGTTHRVLVMITGLQLFTIVASRGNVILLGEAYAFGVVWSFVFMAFSMFMLRIKDPQPREFKVPGNIRIRGVEVPVGLGIILLILLVSAIMNFLTKELATIGGVIFTSLFFTIFFFSERYYERRRRGASHEHLEQFNKETAAVVSIEELGLTNQYRKLVSIRSPYNLSMLEKALAETDPDTTDVVVMTAKTSGNPEPGATPGDLDRYDQELMTAVVQRAEKAGKEVHPLIVPTNNPLDAIMRTARELKAQELIVGASNKYTADEQLEQMAFYWISIHGGEPTPLTVRILSRDRDMYLDLHGGNRIPKISEAKARTVAELRAAGVGVDRVLMVHDGTSLSSDLFQGVLTMLDPQVALTVVPVLSPTTENGKEHVEQDLEKAKHLGRELQLHHLDGEPGAEIVRLAQEGQFDLIVVSLPPELPVGSTLPLEGWIAHVLRHAHCRVFLTTPPAIPQEVVDKGGA